MSMGIDCLTGERGSDVMQILADDARVLITIDILAQAEARLTRLVVDTADESVVMELATVLRDLGMIRMQVELPGPKDARMSARIHERAVVCVTRSDGRTIDAALHDISAGGALIESDWVITDGDRCLLQIPGVDQAVSAIARAAPRGMTHLVFWGLDASQVITLVKHIERHFLRY